MAMSVNEVNFSFVLEETIFIVDEKGQWMPAYVSVIFHLVNFVFLCTLVCLFGIVANTLNIIIFVQQGFSYTMNISLCGLTISDLCCLITDLWFNICMNPLVRNSDIAFVSAEVQYLTGGLPAVCFSRISGWITVFITAERCLGIALPLKVKQLITPGRTFFIICIVYIVNIIAIATDYLNFRLVWTFNSERNRTLYRMVMNSPDHRREILCYVLNSVIGYVSFIAVIVFTAILVVKLVQKSAWRRKATLAKENKAEVMSHREKRTVKMVVLIACVTITCYTPGTTFAAAMIFHPEFRILGLYQEAFLAVWSFGFLCQNINASVNIFLYYCMSTKYRHSFQEMILKVKPH